MLPRRCPYCNQLLPDIRLGVRLTPLKARIFDLIQRGGRDGIDRVDLFDIVFGGTGQCRETLKAHIFQINEAIEDSGYKIVGRSVARLERCAILCEGCGVNYADPPSKLCPGCQAYQEHTA
jgi:hypothetical protein